MRLDGRRARPREPVYRGSGIALYRARGADAEAHGMARRRWEEPVRTVSESADSRIAGEVDVRRWSSMSGRITLKAVNDELARLGIQALLAILSGERVIHTKSVSYGRQADSRSVERPDDRAS